MDWMRAPFTEQIGAHEAAGTATENGDAKGSGGHLKNNPENRDVEGGLPEGFDPGGRIRQGGFALE
jgi:hypothetical protein